MQRVFENSTLYILITYRYGIRDIPDIVLDTYQKPFIKINREHMMMILSLHFILQSISTSDDSGSSTESEPPTQKAQKALVTPKKSSTSKEAPTKHSSEKRSSSKHSSSEKRSATKQSKESDRKLLAVTYEGRKCSTIKDDTRKSSTSKEHTRKSGKELFPDKSPCVS